MSDPSASPAPKSSASHHTTSALLYEQSAVASESNTLAAHSPPSPPPPATPPSADPPSSSESGSNSHPPTPPPQSPPPPNSSSSPPSPPKRSGSPPPPPKSTPSPPPESSPPSSTPPSPPPPPTSSSSPPQSKSSPPPAPPKSPSTPPSSSSTPSPSPPSQSASAPAPSSKSTSPSDPAKPSSPTLPSGDDSNNNNNSADNPPPPTGGDGSSTSAGAADQANRPPGTPLPPPAVPGAPVPPNPAIPAVPAAPKEPAAADSTPRTPPSSTPPANASSSATHSSSSTSHTGTVIGLTVAGVFLLALIAVIFVFVRRRKKKSPYPPNYMPPPPGAAAEGYYQGPNSGPAESYYSNGPFPQSSFEQSYGSQRERTNAAIGASVTDSGQVIAGSKVHFSYEELMEITNGFSRQNVLGEGGFGCVYKGWMPDGRVVAVKQLKASSGQGEKEFRAEVEIITRVHHRHLVTLVGYCISEQQRLLIYEFVPNQTLEHHLHGHGMPVLEWTKRLKIALGSAKGLAYLHEDCHPKIIHRDIKSANILLDDSFEAQVADFGLAKLTDDMNTHVSTRVMGTFGYMAPEYASSGKLTDRSDVFSFGVVLLELVTGRKPVDPTQPLGDESLVEWARPLLIKALESGDLSELVDPRLEKHYVEGEMLRMVEAAAACVRHSATKRPRMARVCRALDCEGEGDLSNGVKFGQSTAYDSGQYNEDIAKFRRMALGSGSSSEFDMSSAEYAPASREISGPQASWTNNSRPDASSDESETRAFTNQGSASRNQHNNSARRF